ncbi:cyclodeaminase/cyclohydrolase family protein [Paenibacillus sp. P26]|nr:cyclodeaminase/cyclohydrolase family protein [Paenibacillus sp. P26]
MSEVITWDSTIREFLQKAASKEPTPGGGSAAALVAAVGAAMTSMVGHLSQGEKFAAVQDEIAETLEGITKMAAACEELLEADIRSFEQYMAAYRLPKQTEEERELRKQAMHQAAVGAILVPLRLMEACLEGMRLTGRITEPSNRNVISDLGIGAILLASAAESAYLTIELNLLSLRDPAQQSAYAEKAAGLMKEIGERKEHTVSAVRRRMAGA